MTITSATAGALISYTTNGTTPSATGGTASPVTVTVGAAETIQAIAYKSGMTNSAVATAAYTMAAAVATPTFSPVAGAIPAGTTVTITSATAGALISYTTNGTTPSATGGTASPVTVTVSAAETIEASAYKSGMSNSAVATAAYTLAANVYAHVRPITINHTKVPNTDQTNFPILVSGVYPFLANTANGGQVQNASGYDIIFTADYAGTTQLDHEIESYDPTTGTINVWVRIPTLSHTCDTIIYAAYGNAAITTSQENRTGVWTATTAQSSISRASAETIAAALPIPPPTKTL